MLSRIAQGDPSHTTQSWLICGPPGSGRSNMARAFAAALESPDHGISAEAHVRYRAGACRHSSSDVTVLTTNKVTIGIDPGREIITTSSRCPPRRGASSSSKTVDRMLERTTNVLLKEIEEPAEHCIWRPVRAQRPGRAAHHPLAHTHREPRLTRALHQAVAGFLTSTTNVSQKWRSVRPIRRRPYRHRQVVRHRRTGYVHRDELVVGVLNLARASDAVLLAGNLIDNAKAQAEADANRITAARKRNSAASTDWHRATASRRNCVAHSTRLPRKTM